jgi:hypothetical protein
MGRVATSLLLSATAFIVAVNVGKVSPPEKAIRRGVPVCKNLEQERSHNPIVLVYGHLCGSPKILRMSSQPVLDSPTDHDRHAHPHISVLVLLGACLVPVEVLAELLCSGTQELDRIFRRVLDKMYCFLEHLRVLEVKALDALGEARIKQVRVGDSSPFFV